MSPAAAAGAPADPADAPPVSHLLYLHGFRSSPLSTKARLMAAWIERHRADVVWHCPQLPASPAAALAMLVAHFADWPAASRAVVGSSLGGFYASVLGERFGCRTVLLNPAVAPARDLADRIGETTAWHSDEAFHFRPEYVAQLARMTPARLHNQPRTLAVIAKGDEVLDWREMVERHAGAQITLLDGGDHALSDFSAHLPAIARFLGWAAGDL